MVFSFVCYFFVAERNKDGDREIERVGDGGREKDRECSNYIL